MLVRTTIKENCWLAASGNDELWLLQERSSSHPPQFAMAGKGYTYINGEIKKSRKRIRDRVLRCQFNRESMIS